MDAEDKIEQWMDEALRQYGRADAGLGFENRVLARVTERQGAVRFRERPWWGFGLAAVLATVVLGAIWISYKPGVTSHPVAQSPSHEGATTKEKRLPLEQVPTAPNTTRTASTGRHMGVATARRRSVEATQASESAKLDQFPSPAPLSEQEQLLARYVSEHRQHAVMLARVQTDWLDQERREEQGPNEKNVTDEER